MTDRLEQKKKQSRYLRLLQNFFAAELSSRSKNNAPKHWIDLLKAPLNEITREIVPGEATYTLHEVIDDYVVHKETGPPERARLRTTLKPSKCTVGRIGAALKAASPYQFDDDVSRFSGPAYVTGREDTVSELVALVPGVEGLSSMGIINIETDESDAFDDVDGRYTALLGSWAGTVAGAVHSSKEYLTILEYLVLQLDIPHRETTDAEKRIALWDKTIEGLRHVIPFDDAGVVSAVDSSEGPALHIEYLTDGYDLTPERRDEFYKSQDTLSARLVAGCIDRPFETSFIEYDAKADGGARYNVQYFRPGTEYSVGIGATYDAANRCHLAITLDCDRTIQISSVQKECAKILTHLAGYTLVQIETQRQLIRQNQIRKATILQNEIYFNPKIAEYQEFTFQALSELKATIHADDCLILFRRNDDFEILDWSRGFSNLYWTHEIKDPKTKNRFLGALRHGFEPPFYITSGKDGRKFLVFTAVVNLDRRALLVTVKDVTNRPDVRRVSSGSREAIESYIPILERGSALRQARGQLSWVKKGLEASLRMALQSKEKQDEVIVSTHTFFKSWEPVSSPFSAVYWYSKRQDGSEILVMSDASYGFLLNESMEQARGVINETPLELRVEEKGLTSEVWRSGAHWAETTERGYEGCRNWWDTLTGMSAKDRMFAGDRFGAEDEKKQAGCQGVFTLNGPRRFLAISYPEFVGVIGDVVRIATRVLSEELRRCSDG